MKRAPAATAPRESGSVSVEFVLLSLFVLLPVTLATVDFGQVFHTRYVLARAVEQGVMAASQGNDPASVVSAYLSSARQDPARLTVTVTPGYDTLPIGVSVTVTAAYNLAGLAIIPWENALPAMTVVTAQATARHR